MMRVRNRRIPERIAFKIAKEIVIEKVGEGNLSRGKVRYQKGKIMDYVNQIFNEVP